MREENLATCRREMGKNEFSWSGLNMVGHTYAYRCPSSRDHGSILKISMHSHMSQSLTAMQGRYYTAILKAELHIVNILLTS